jgi:hypothetical protein
MCYAKVLKKGTHEGPKVLKKKFGHMKVQVQKGKNDEHMKAHVKKRR